MIVAGWDLSKIERFSVGTEIYYEDSNAEYLGDDKDNHLWRARFGPEGNIWYQCFPVVKITNAGRWINTSARLMKNGGLFEWHIYKEDHNRKFILDRSKKKYACPTKEQAAYGLYRRTLSRMRLLFTDFLHFSEDVDGLKKLFPQYKEDLDKALKPFKDDVRRTLRGMK